jgi:Uma2 family endonuclease
MAVVTHSTAEDYLRAAYHPDCEYVDGEILERNAGEKGHSKVQKQLVMFVAQHESEWGVFALQEWRVRFDSRHYRVPDLSISAGPEPDEDILTVPPLVCVEILSPEDRLSGMQKKVADYLEFGVRYVWVLDPKAKSAFEYTRSGMREVHDALRTEDPAMEIPLEAIFE